MGLKRTVLTLLTLSLSTVVSANLCPDIIGCYCFPSGDEYRAECSGSDIEQIPAGLPYNITQLMIRDSPIKVLLAGNLSYYSEILELEMVNNPDFESVQPGALMGMNQLQSLIFRSNALSSLPSDIFSDTPDIVSIDISDNRLDNLPEFPLPSLESLTVDKNQITTVPINAFSQCLDLMLLDLSHNDINNVGSNAFYNLQSLEHLNLEFNSINSINTGTFSSNSALKELSLNSNKLTSIPSGVFSGLSSLQLLDLNKNGIQTIASTAFQGLSNLERLDLSNNEMSNVPSQSFQHTPNLVELYLQGNPFVIIPQNSFHDLPEMTSLFLGESSALTDIETDAFAELPALSLLSIIKSPNLLNLTLQELPDAALRSVMSLHISGNGFTHLGLSTFESKESLQELYLHTNPFHCSCALKWMTRVVEDGVPWASGWKDSGTPPRCHTPEILKDYKIPHMKEVDFTCDPPYVERISPPIVYTYLKETTEIQVSLSHKVQT